MEREERAADGCTEHRAAREGSKVVQEKGQEGVAEFLHRYCHTERMRRACFGNSRHVRSCFQHTTFRLALGLCLLAVRRRLT